MGHCMAYETNTVNTLYLLLISLLVYNNVHSLFVFPYAHGFYAFITFASRIHEHSSYDVGGN